MLDSVLRRLPRQTDPRVLVGFDTSDDAGVYLLTDEVALVQTVDFFTPIVDDPFLFGAIAAANSLSDVYAMGGRPVSALSIVAFPPAADPALMEQILRGGLSKMEEAGCTIVGGHSIRDDDMKFGYAVTGVVHPQRVWRNVGAQPGDVLLLTKPLGTGLIATALKSEKAAEESVAAAVASMSRLNRDAADALHSLASGIWNLESSGKPASGALATGNEPGAPAASRPSEASPDISNLRFQISKFKSEISQSPVHAVTDVTGFGLLGHAREMALGSPVAPASVRPSEASPPALPSQAPATSAVMPTAPFAPRVTLEIDSAAIEPLPGALDAARAGFLAGGLKNNREFLAGCYEFADSISEEMRALLFDPQTSGGLLVAIAPVAADAALAALRARNVHARRIGRVLPKAGALLRIT